MTERKNVPLPGEPFPEIEVYTTRGKMVLPYDYNGKWFVLFTHPGDFTPVCTSEFVSLQKRYSRFREINCELIGLSVDQMFSHIKWLEWIEENLGVEIEFPLIADFGGLSGELGLIHPEMGSNTVRALFIVDPKGIIRAIFYYPREMGRNIDEVLRTVKGLQISDENEVMIPADWPENDLIGDHGILFPPLTVSGRKDRKMKADSGDLECKDWWFCHRKIV
jgi:peroxiredoxin (alkyl hydroperoxide reductase subunit C)